LEWGREIYIYGFQKIAFQNLKCVDFYNDGNIYLTDPLQNVKGVPFGCCGGEKFWLPRAVELIADLWRNNQKKMIPVSSLKQDKITRVKLQHVAGVDVEFAITPRMDFFLQNS
jgi:hypothetical protein